MAAYYNENDAFAAAWLKNLIAAGLLPEGDVDERSIVDVQPDDLRNYDQCHFFAGIGGWPYALELAGWEDPVWTGSCPCQPLSSAGLQKGHADERHLWPAFYRLIAECRPPVVFGEQVTNKLGREWMSGVRADLESCGYALGIADLPAACVGSPSKRQRFFWVADAAGARRCGRDTMETRGRTKSGGSSAHVRFADWPDHAGSGTAVTVADVLSPSYGLPGRMGRLRGYGNAILAEVGAEFVMAYMDARAAAPNT